MTAEQRAALRIVAESLPAGTVVPVLREQLLELLGDAATQSSPAATELLTVDQVAAKLGMGEQFVYRKKKALGAVKVGRSVRFPPAAIDRFIARRSSSRLSVAA